METSTICAGEKTMPTTTAKLIGTDLTFNYGDDTIIVSVPDHNKLEWYLTFELNDREVITEVNMGAVPAPEKYGAIRAAWANFLNDSGIGCDKRFFELFVDATYTWYCSSRDSRSSYPYTPTKKGKPCQHESSIESHDNSPPSITKGD